MSVCRVFISADIEGVAGIVTRLQTADGAAQYHGTDRRSRPRRRPHRPTHRAGRSGS